MSAEIKSNGKKLEAECSKNLHTAFKRPTVEDKEMERASLLIEDAKTVEDLMKIKEQIPATQLELYEEKSMAQRLRDLAQKLRKAVIVNG